MGDDLFVARARRRVDHREGGRGQDPYEHRTDSRESTREGAEGTKRQLAGDAELQHVVKPFLEHVEPGPVEPVRPKRDEAVADEDGQEVGDDAPAQVRAPAVGEADENRENRHLDAVRDQELRRVHAGAGPLLVLYTLTRSIRSRRMRS